MDLDRAHMIARQRGPIMPVYWIARAILQPFFLVYFRLNRIGKDQIPSGGPVLIASNHRSFSDPFFIAMCIRRPLRFVAKIELFDKRWKAWLLLALGAFPIRRGESDEQAMETARVILEQGGALGVFPEGTRVRPGPLGEPKRGIGRLALETGAPIVPVALVGTEDIRKGWRIRPRRVTVRCGKPMTFPRPLDREPRHGLAQQIADRVWSSVSLHWEWLGGRAPLRHAVVVGAGSWGTSIAVLLARSGASVQLVCRTEEQVTVLRSSRANATYLPGVELPADVRPMALDDVQWADVEAVCLALPSHALAQALEELVERIPSDAGVVVLTKGLVGPDGYLPSATVRKTSPTRPIACLGGPAHALEAVQRSASVIVASKDREFSAVVAGALRTAGLSCHTSTDVVGVEFAGVAKNAAALAAGAALGAGANAAGAAAGQVYAECHALALAFGAKHESFTGLAGTGDLVATVLAATSRNRRAGELLARGVGPGEIHDQLGQVPEAVYAIPALARAMQRADVHAPATRELAAVVRGEMPAQEWLRGTRHGRAPRHAA